MTGRGGAAAAAVRCICESACRQAASADLPRRRRSFPASAQVLERGTRQLVSVPLTKNGHQLGAVELQIQHQAMQPHAE